MPAVNLLAAWMPIHAEPGDALSIDVTVPVGYEATVGAWSASVWNTTRKGSSVASFGVALSGQTLTLTMPSATTAALIPSGSASFSGYWELDRTVSSAARTWLKGDFILDPVRQDPGA